LIELPSSDEKSTSKKPTNEPKEVKNRITTNKDLIKAGSTNRAKSRAKVVTVNNSSSSTEIPSSDSDRENKKITLLRTGELIKDLEEFESSEHNKTRNRVSSKINARVGEREVKALVDTGAQINAISKDFYEEILNAGSKITTIPINRFTVRGAFTDKGEPIAFKTAMEVIIDERTYVVEFYIMKKLVYEMILGMEFLTRHRAVINCTGDNVQLSLEEVAHVAAIKRLTREEAKARVADILAENAELFKDGIGRINHYVHKIKMNTHLPFKTKNSSTGGTSRSGDRIHKRIRGDGNSRKSTHPIYQSASHRDKEKRTNKTMLRRARVEQTNGERPCTTAVDRRSV